jgi:hypothetical protein
MKKLFGAWNQVETRRFNAPIQNITSCNLYGRFWYREVRDFLNSKHTALCIRLLANQIIFYRLSEAGNINCSYEVHARSGFRFIIRHGTGKVKAYRS